MLAAVLINRCFTHTILSNNLEVISKFKTVVISSSRLSSRSIHSHAVRSSLSLYGRLCSKFTLRKNVLSCPPKRHSYTSKVKQEYLMNKPKNNVFLYKNETATYRMLRWFAFGQMVGWIGIAALIYHPELSSIFYKNITFMQYIDKCGLHLLFFFWPLLAGTIVICALYAYLTRTVKYIILHKEGQLVSIVTYGLFKRDYKLTKKVTEICTTVGREEAKGIIPLKIKKYRFNYLVSSSGDFVNKALYDNTIGYKKLW